MSPSSKRVLIVDDDPDFCMLVSTLVQMVAEHVVCASTAAEGLAAARRERCDLILCDVGLPEIDGFDLRRQIAADPALASIPFIFLSARKSLESQITGFALGAVDYLTKPIGPEAVVARIVHYLNRAEETRVAAAVDEPHHLAGRLEAIPCSHVLQLLEASRSSGTLTATGEHEAGRIVLADGQISFAESRGYVGEDAVFCLLWLREGAFNFDVQKDVEFTGDRPAFRRSGGPMQIAQVALDALWIADELAHHANSIPAVDGRVVIVDAAAAESCFPNNDTWLVITARHAGEPLAVVDLARRLGLGRFRTRVSLGHGVARGALRLVTNGGGPTVD